MNSTVEKNYRHTPQIFYEVLIVTQNSGHDGISVTKLCHKSNLAHGRLQTFIKRLTSSGLVNQIEYDGKNTFVITEKGRLFLEEYTKFHEFAGSFGLEM